MRQPSRSLSENASPREFSIEFGTIKWRCSDSLQYLIVQKLHLGKYFHLTLAFQRSLWKCAHPREFSLGFGTINTFVWRCIDLLPMVSSVYNCTEAVLGEIFPKYASLPELPLEMRPPVSSLSGSVPSSHCFGAVAIYYRRSLQYSIVQMLFLGISVPHTPAFQRSSLEMRPCLEFSLGFGTIKASFWRCTKLLPEVSTVFDRTDGILREIFSTYASFPEVSLEMRHPREFSLGFGTIQASFWRCTKLLLEVSPAFVF